MEPEISVCTSHKFWRRIAKKERRRRLRRKNAREREADEERLRATLERSAEYLKWIDEEEKEEKARQDREKREHEEREKQWLEEEVRAQEEWLVIQEKKAKARQQQLQQEAKIRQEFEVKQEAIRKKKEEEKKKREEEIKRREQLQKEIDDYIDNGVKTPEALREVIDSQPGKELCPFFTKTGACRYGDTCSRNHRRVCLSRVILVPGFYSHFSLEKNSAEYDTDVGLEFESSETRQHFREFYKDVVPELESFGRIKTLKYCCNTEVHLRGNLYVEYYRERDAARALRKLKGRWYAGRQLNCEFANLKSWRSAVCGMSKCPKGRACNFLHTFRNPHDEYDIKSPPRWAKGNNPEANSSRRSERMKSKWEESVRADEEERNWRWSETPEVEVEHRLNNTDKNHRQYEERHHGHYRKSTRIRKRDHSERSKGFRSILTPEKKRHRSRIDHTDDNKARSNGEERSSPRRHGDTQSKKRDVNNVYESRSARKPCGSESTENTCSRRSEYRKALERKEAKRIERNGKQKLKNLRKVKSSEGIPNGRSMSASKSKWDNERSVESTSESSGSDDSESSSSPASKRQRITPERSDDEWATTDSEHEYQEKRR